MNTTTQQTALNQNVPCKPLAVRFSILCPLESGGTVVHVFLVEARATIDWFRAHSAELAQACWPDSGYTALNIEIAQ